MTRGRKKQRAKKHSSTSTKSGVHASDRRAGSAEPRLTIEQLEPRILLSATWIDADAGGEIEDATIGDVALAESEAADPVAAIDSDDLILGSENDEFLQDDSPVATSLTGDGSDAGSSGGSGDDSGGGSGSGHVGRHGRSANDDHEDGVENDGVDVDAHGVETLGVDAHDDEVDREKVVICHVPPGNPDRSHTIIVSTAAQDAHLAHGDVVGECGDVNAEAKNEDETELNDSDGDGMTVGDADAPAVDEPETDDATTESGDDSVTVVDTGAPVVDEPTTDDAATADGDGSVTVVDADAPVVDEPATDDATKAGGDESATVVDVDATDKGSATETEAEAWSDPPIPVVPDSLGSDEPDSVIDSGTVRTEQVGDALTEPDSPETMILSEGPTPLIEGEAPTSDDSHDSGDSIDASPHGDLDADAASDNPSDRSDADELLAGISDVELSTYLDLHSADASELFEVVGGGPFDDVFEEASAPIEGLAMPDRGALDVRARELPTDPTTYSHLPVEPGFVPTPDAEFGPHPADPYDAAARPHRPEEDSSLEHRASDVNLPHETPGAWSADGTSPGDGPERLGWFAQLWGLVRGRGGTTVEEVDTAGKSENHAGRKMN